MQNLSNIPDWEIKETPLFANFKTMIIDIITNQDFHKNGTLAYIETFAVIDPNFKDLFSNIRVDNKGAVKIRIGLNAKFKDDGQIVWKIIYDKSGNIINERK